MKEQVFRYGENQRGLGVLTLPSVSTEAPIVVLLNAGLLHRTEPYRLNVLLARTMATIGYICLRVDLSGNGDTPARDGVTTREGIAMDWDHIKQSLTGLFGKRTIVIMGLCSGADTAVRMSATDESVKGLILLDPVAEKDRQFYLRKILYKVTTLQEWLDLPFYIYRRISKKVGNQKIAETGFRDEPELEETQHSCAKLVERKGKVIAIFTNHVLYDYNKQGQLAEALMVPGFENICEEVFWPHMSHLYPIQAHRDELVEKIHQWAKAHYREFKGKTM